MERLSIAGPSTASVSGIFLGAGRVDKTGGQISFVDSAGVYHGTMKTQESSGNRSKTGGFASEIGLWRPSASDSQDHGQWPLGSHASDRGLTGVRW